MALRVIRSDGRQVLARADSSGALITHEKSLDPLHFRRFRFVDGWVEVDSTPGGRLMAVQGFNNGARLGYFFFQDSPVDPATTLPAWSGSGAPPDQWGSLFTLLVHPSPVIQDSVNMLPNGIQYFNKLWCRFRFFDNTAPSAGAADIEWSVLFTNDIQT